MPLGVLQHGFIVQECHPGWRKISCPDGLNEPAALALLRENDVRVLVFASSIKDPTALRLARAARGLSLPVIHVLDNWTNYRRRMETDGLPAFTPDYYTVMDEKAYRDAVQDGVEESSLVVTGHTIWSGLPLDIESAGRRNRQKELTQRGFEPDWVMIAFISEPVEQDQGGNPESPYYRGYTEKGVLRLFLKSLQPVAHRVQIGVVPHPREDRKALERLWQECRLELPGEMLLLPQGRDCLFISDALAGMASILLHEAWLLGLPVLILQPGLRLAELRTLQGREGVTFIDSREPSEEAVRQWAGELEKATRLAPRPELRLHRQGPQKVLGLIRRSLEKSTLQRI
jgi:hypothetical protein